MERASTVRPTSLSGSLQTILLMVVFCLVAGTATGDLRYGVLLGTIGFLIYRIGIVRMVLCRDHRRGVLLTRVGKFEEALPAFAASREWWDAHPTLDRRRAILLGSAVRWPFSWLARYNRAYCLSRLGRGAEAIEELDTLIAKTDGWSIATELREVLQAGEAANEAAGPANWDELLEPEEE